MINPADSAAPGNPGPGLASRSAGRPLSWRRLTGGAAAVAAAMTFAIAPAPGAAAAGASVQPAPVPRVVWQGCAAGSAAAQAGGFTCATILVPLDYQDPAGPQIKLALVRHAATGPARMCTPS